MSASVVEDSPSPPMSLNSLTLADWWNLDAGARDIVLDALAERIPAGFSDLRAAGSAPTPLPCFVHESTGVIFHVVFGGPAVIGMTERRWERLRRVSQRPERIGPYDDVACRHELEPPRHVVIETALVADQPLQFGVLKKLGLPEKDLMAMGVRPPAGTRLLALAQELGWRAPSEAEWEYVCRAAEDDVGDAPLDRPAGRLEWSGLVQMGQWDELCSDAWHHPLHPIPDEPEPAHQVTCGSGPGRTYGPAFGTDAWFQCLWPGRRHRKRVKRNLSLRPWVSLGK